MKFVRKLNLHSQLVVKMVKINLDPQEGEGTIWFDYFNVTGVPLAGVPLASTTPSPVAPPPAAQKKANNIGPIVGGVVGGVLILVLLVMFLLFYRRRRRPSNNVKLPIEPETPAAGELPHTRRSTISYLFFSFSPPEPSRSQRKSPYGVH